jgi:hypothetical protein
VSDGMIGYYLGFFSGLVSVVICVAFRCWQDRRR